MGVPLFLMSARAALCSFIHGSHDSAALRPTALFFFLGRGRRVQASVERDVDPLLQIMPGRSFNHCCQCVSLSLSCSALLLLPLFSGFSSWILSLVHLRPT